jgi:uncharacterized membrane protein SpoIIM required for sporulation
MDAQKKTNWMRVGRATTATAVSKAAFFGLAGLAVLPHLVLEASAYVTASLASIFLSRGMFLYAYDDPRLRRVAGAAGRMLGLAVGLLVTAALVESTLPKLVFSRLG